MGDPSGRGRTLGGSRRTWIAPGLAAILVFSAVIASVSTVPEPASAFPTPGTNAGVAVGPGSPDKPSLAVDAAGTLHLVRADDVSGERGVYYTSSGDGVTWSPSARIDTAGTASYFPRIAVEREPVGIRGRLYVAYQRGTGATADIWFTTSDGGAFWNPPRQVDLAPAGAPSISPSIAASDRAVYVAWSDDRDAATYQVYGRASLDGGASWGPEVLLSFAGISNLQSRTEAKGDSVVVVWRQASPGVVSIRSARSDDRGATWRYSAVTVGPTAADQPRDPDVFLDELGVAHVAWVLQDGTGAARAYYAFSGDGLTWSNPVRVDDTPAIVRMGAPSISGLAGTLWVAWHDSRTGDFDIYASWSTDGVTWGDGLLNGNDLRVDDTDRNGLPFDDATNQGNVTLKTGGFGVYAAWEDARNGAGLDTYFGSVQVSPLLITEIQDEPAAQARVEIYNFDRVAFAMTGVWLDTGLSNVDLSPLGAIPARSYRVVGRDPGSADLVVPIDLGSEGALVRLVRGAEVLASAGSGGYGIAPDPLPGESSSRLAGTLDYVPVWTRTAASTFKQPNVATPADFAPAVVLNEVLFNPANPGDRFVELYLRGAGPVDLTGYRVVGDSEYVFTGGTINAANPYAFVFEGRAPAWFGPLDAARDNVYLYDPAGRLLDMVGWTSPHAVGTSVSRVALGVGGLRAYEEASAAANGWAFDTAPTLAILALASDQTLFADIGTSVQFVLQATNRQTTAEYVNVVASAAKPGWPTIFLWPDATPLSDSAGDPDALADLGLVGPGVTVAFIVQVTVPSQGVLGDTNTITATVVAASLPVARASVDLTVNLYPHFDVQRDVNPTTVYLQGSGPPYNEIAQITLNITGAGFPTITLVPQDVVFQIDVSGSMSTNDPFNIRIDAVQNYIDGMRVDDRGAIIGFATTAWVVNNRPLTYTDPPGKAVLKTDADTLRFANGATNIFDALGLGNQWLITYATNMSRARVEILLTDGVDTTGHTDAQILNQAQNAANNGITVYTIGLVAGGPGNVNEPLLMGIATLTGGQYFRANTAQDLLAIYDQIGRRINRTAGVDPDPLDAIPLIEDDVAPYLTIDANSFYDPMTGSPRPPSLMQQLGDRWRLQWNVNRIQINETWAVRFNVRSTRLGLQGVALYPDARVDYLRWDGSIVSQPFPQGQLEVLQAPSPPFITNTNPMNGATSVPLSQVITALFNTPMDGPTVVWTIAPPIALSPSWAGSTILMLSHSTDFAECTRYTIEVTQAFDTDGEALVPGPVPNPWSFTTVCPLRVTYTITRTPLVGNLDVVVDGTIYRAPTSFVWLVGDTHAIGAPDYDALGPSRLAFLAWDDGGPRAHPITVADVDTTITAGYALQHPANVVFLGLDPGRPAGVRFRLFGSNGASSSATAWADWVDDGSSVDVDGLVPGAAGERFITRDPTQWTATGPLAETVRYFHQFTADLRFVGLEGHLIAVDFVAFGSPSNTATALSWSDWVDATSALRADDLVPVSPRERYRTLDDTRWTVDAPVFANVTFLHQFRPRVLLLGLDEDHTVGAVWRIDAQAAARTGLSSSLYEWADAMAEMHFDARTTGEPPLHAQGSTGFVVDSAFDATIVYASRPPPPPVNWKPILAVVYAIGLFIAGATFGTRALDRYVPGSSKEERSARAIRWKGLPVGQKFAQMSIKEVEEKVHRDRRFTRLLLVLPFGGGEAAIGVLSFFTGLFRIPDAGNWFPAGFWVNTALLCGGVAAGLAVFRKGYRMTDDALLRLAEARARGAAHAAPERADDD